MTPEPRRRRVWFAGDTEPTIGQKVLVAGQVWMRHPQLRWILAPGGNGCQGLEWRRLINDDHTQAIEVFDDEPYKPYGGLIRTPPTAATVNPVPPKPTADPAVEREAAYRDQGDYGTERRQDMRCHVGNDDGYALCDGSPLDWAAARPLSQIPDVVRCKKRGCKQHWPEVAR
jgi:hypothetical protein